MKRVFFVVFSLFTLFGMTAAEAKEDNAILTTEHNKFIPWKISDTTLFLFPVPHGFEHKFSAPRNNLVEYGLVEEEIEKWSRLVTYTLVLKPNSESVMRKFFNNFVSGYQRGCEQTVV